MSEPYECIIIRVPTLYTHNDKLEREDERLVIQKFETVNSNVREQAGSVDSWLNPLGFVIPTRESSDNSNFSNDQQPLTSGLNQASEERVLCELCGKTFSNKKVLWRHRFEVHGKKSSPGCQLCRKSKYRKTDNKTSSKGHHSCKLKQIKEERVICEICGKSLKNKRVLWGHKTGCHGRRPKFACRFCPLVYRRKQGAVRHEKKVHSRLTSA